MPVRGDDIDQVAGEQRADMAVDELAGQMSSVAASCGVDTVSTRLAAAASAAPTPEPSAAQAKRDWGRRRG